MQDLRNRIFEVTPESFGETALEVFRFQAGHCALYRRYLELLGITDPAKEVQSVQEIPYLPVEFFKTQRVYASSREPEIEFTSSGTTGAETSRHLVADASLYEESFMQGFSYFYGNPAGWSVFALLPAYLEREGSSLVYMAEHLQAQNKTHGGFFLYEYDKLLGALRKAVKNGEKILLIGVAFALLDFADYLAGREDAELVLPEDAVVMETGGMKGRRREISREEMHVTLSQAFGVNGIHSEYGMTELLSQAYSDGEGVFRCPPWMRGGLRDLQNPLKPVEEVDKPGGVNVIDLANLYSCSFLAIQDRGVLVDAEGGFRVLGRIEGAQIRGCNMLVE